MPRIKFLFFLFASFTLLHPGHSSAQIQAPIQVAPQGAIASNTPEFI